MLITKIQLFLGRTESIKGGFIFSSSKPLQMSWSPLPCRANLELLCHPAQNRDQPSVIKV